MKRYVLVFAVSFLLGYLLLASRETVSSVEVSGAEIADQMRASSSRLDDSFSEYEAVMFDDEEKLQLLLDQANTLSSLLGLAEKLAGEGYYDENGLMMVAVKLAKLYPVEAITYYGGRPTHVAMNADMALKVVQSWAAFDLTACLVYLDKDQTRSVSDFCWIWTSLVGQEWPQQSAEILQCFSQLSKQKQSLIVQGGSIRDEIIEQFLPELKDQQLRSAIEARMRIKLETQLAEKTETQERQKSPDELERDKCNEMIEDIKARKLAAEDIATMLRDVQSRENRMRILSDILERRFKDDETTDAWLTRISEVLAVVDEIPDHTPNHAGKGYDPSHEKLQAWLPKQSIRLQRAWADDVVDDMNGEEAMQWIETLSQASLRADMRDEVLASWAEDSPIDAAEFIVEKATLAEQEDYLPEAVYRWALRDYAAAKQWIEAQVDSSAKAEALQKLGQGQ
jgi:organic radical activating enzyme